MDDLLPSYRDALALVRYLRQKWPDDWLILANMESELQWIIAWLLTYRRPWRRPRMAYLSDAALEAAARHDPRPHQALSRAEAAAARQGTWHLHPALIDLPAFGHHQQQRARRRTPAEAAASLAQVFEAAGLAPEEEAAARLVWGEGLTFREAAVRLGVARGTVGNLLAQTQKKVTAWSLLERQAKPS